jgi:site-specific DNA recombinase
MSEDPNDQLLLQIRGAVSEYERSLIAERMRRGRQHTYRAGVLLPWTRPPYGYRLNPDHPRDPAGVRVEATEGAIVSELFARSVQPGQSLSSLSTYLKQLNVPTPPNKKRWSNGTLRRILTNPVYTGVVYAGRGRVQPAQRRRWPLAPVGQRMMTSMPTSKDQWIVVGHLPALVTQESFEQVLLLAQKQPAIRSSQQSSPYLPLASPGQLWLLSAGMSWPNAPRLLVLRLCGQIPSQPLGSRRAMSPSPHSYEAARYGGLGGSL